MKFKIGHSKLMLNYFIYIFLAFSSLESLGQVNRISYKDPYYISKFIIEGDTSYVLNIHELIEGKAIVYYDFNIKKVLIESNLHQGKKQGRYVSYYRNDAKKTEAYYDNDNPDSLFQEWHSNGQIKNKGIFIKGLKDGKFEEWYENGMPKFSGIFNKGIKEGIFIDYFPNGNKKQLGEFFKDNLIKSTIWKKNGKLFEKMTFEYNELYTDSLFYENGKLKKSLNLGIDPSGKTKYWSMDGIEISKEEFDNIGCTKP